MYPPLHCLPSPIIFINNMTAATIGERKVNGKEEHQADIDALEDGYGVIKSNLIDDDKNERDAIGLEWVNVSYSIPVKEGNMKTLIHPMSGSAIPGEMLALMGTSGAGKSTLLDILAGRLLSENLTGKILANKRPINFSSFRKQSGYVMQSDALFPLLTVKETLYYAAHLRIQGKTYAEREAAAAGTMKLLRLDHVENTIIGDELNRGLSGGEKRRVSIAVDIIHEPRVIFLDEPTSGDLFSILYVFIITFAA